MMDLRERIRNILDYFLFMNVNEEAFYILVKFPSKWVVPTDASDSVKIMKGDNAKDTYYFFTDFNNGYEPLFDTVDEIIRQNREIEEKYKLFNSKLSELKLLFENEDLSVLENMKFNIGATTNDKKDETVETEMAVETPEKEEQPNEEQKEEAVEEEEKTEKKNKPKNKKNNISASIMDSAKKLINQ